MPNFENPGGDKSLWDQTREFIEQRPLRKELGSKKTVSIGGKELGKGDRVYSKTKSGKTIEWDIRYWDDFGVILRPSNADSLSLKERLLGGADEHLFEWSRLDMFSTEPNQE